MLIHHIKRHFNHPISYLLYGIIVIYFMMSGTLISQNEMSTLSVDIAVVDRADDDISNRYIEDLKKYDIITLYQTDYARASDLLQREVVDAVMVIPESYDPNQKDHKIDYYHLKTNVLAPATIDLLAVDLMPDIVKYRLQRAANRYQLSDGQYALERFEHYSNTIRGQLSVAVFPIGKRADQFKEQTLTIVTNVQKQLTFALFIIVLGMALPLTVTLIINNTTLHRISICNCGIAGYTIGERLVSYLYLILPWLIVCSSLVMAVDINIDGTLLVVTGAIIIICYYEVFRLLFNVLNNKSTASLAALLALVVPALVGGVFFDSDLLPESIRAFSRALPFNTLESAFYSKIATHANWRGSADLAIYLGAIIAFTVLNYALSKRRIQRTTP